MVVTSPANIENAKYSENPLEETRVTFKGHMQINKENLKSWGFTDTEIVSDKMIMRQNWKKAYIIDEESMDMTSSNGVSNN